MITRISSRVSLYFFMIDQITKLNSVDILGLSPVKSVGSKSKIGYGKRKLTQICDVTKGET